MVVILTEIGNESSLLGGYSEFHCAWQCIRFAWVVGQVTVTLASQILCQI